MAIFYEPLSVTTDAAGAGTVSTAAPVNGLILEVRSTSTAFAGTAEFLLTRAGAIGGTVLNLTDAASPWQYAPRQNAHSVTGGSVGAVEPVPSDGYLTLTVSQGGSVASGTVYVLYDRPGH